jgi:hypothetical protein
MRAREYKNDGKLLKNEAIFCCTKCYSIAFYVHQPSYSLTDSLVLFFLKSAAFLHKGRTGSIPVPGTKLAFSHQHECHCYHAFMSKFTTTFEIHVHGAVPLREEVTFEQIQDALRSIWVYAGARSLREGADSFYEEEPGIRFDAKDHILQVCWTIKGEDDFRQALDEMCMALNDLTSAGRRFALSSRRGRSTNRGNTGSHPRRASVAQQRD